VEGRRLVEGNPGQGPRDRTQRRADLNAPLLRIRQAARRDRRQRFTALWHHVYDVDRLEEAYRCLNRQGAAGVDRMTWESYGQELRANLEDLSSRLRRGAYRASPVRRVNIPKADGRMRPIGVPTLEDKIVQRATVEVLNAIYGWVPLITTSQPSPGWAGLSGCDQWHQTWHQTMENVTCRTGDPCSR
jgi:hypothetical protein